MTSQSQLSEQEQYELYGKLCDACNILKKLDITEVDQLLKQGVKAYNEKWEAEHEGYSCLYYLILSADKLSFEQFTETFDKLCQAGANPCKPQGWDGNLLSSAIGFGQAKIAAWLIDVKGMDINSKDKSGHTPLYDAVVSRHQNAKELVKLLVERGASASYRTVFGNTIYDAAPSDIKPLLPKPNIKPGISQQEAWEKLYQPSKLSGLFSLFHHIKQRITAATPTHPVEDSPSPF